ncbi:MAG: ORF6N domain-containing protein [Candidatus Omnitrophica bacterium]|nr:ORF6N domain-containing protein [Candidatus Omnitrophota bacterium]
MKDLISQEVIERKIYLIRGRNVMLDKDLAGLYGVETKNLNLQVKRNIKRFPEDFMFQVTKEENLRLQFATSSYGGRRYLPYVFTEQGVAMLSSVLNSERAIEVNIAIMRAFVRLREILLTHKDLAAKIAALELKYKNHDMRFSEYDKHITAIFEAIKKLMAPPPEKPRRMIGFKQE